MYAKAAAVSVPSRPDAAVAGPFVAALILYFGLTSPAPAGDGVSTTPAQIVALDECDPTTFNAVVGPDFCKNVADPLDGEAPKDYRIVSTPAATLFYLFKSAACELPARPGGHAFLVQASIPASRVQAAAMRSDTRRDSRAT